ncbi:uncharacterized protein BKCO1_5100094 [Diplodia corticola]|uniref:Uncharacterized protein n=1 Tax=Diplodia corticola TaxID=236234 RepID=A0A1J9QS14_9PEZI|nr:uncharacterized protein BKCO1_5100094 [Diplodia corticola]OJD31240.1 hypothetical protein BKCO1_5100094 [Diplodia corticola]
MAPANASSTNSSGSETSTITDDGPKEIILPVWGIIVPPVAQDWINAGFRVTFAPNPATVKTWMVTENGLVQVMFNTGPDTDPRAAEQNPVRTNVDTIQPSTTTRPPQTTASSQSAL